MRKKRKIQHISDENMRETKYEIKYFKLESFLSRHYPEILEEFEAETQENIVYG